MRQRGAAADAVGVKQVRFHDIGEIKMDADAHATAHYQRRRRWQ